MDMKRSHSAVAPPSTEESDRPKHKPRWSVAGVLEVFPLVIKALLTVVILAIFLYLGYHLEQFSGLNSQSSTKSTRLPANPSLTSPMTVRFGEAAHALYHENFVGNEEQLLERVQVACHQMAAARAFPNTEQSEAEKNLLNTLHVSQYTTKGDGILVFQTDSTLPLFVGLRYATNDLPDQVTREMVHQARIVSWGFAVPTATNEWKIRVVGKREQESENGLSTYLPPECGKLLQLDAGNGDSTIAFTSTDSLAVQMESFDQHFSTRDWEQSSPWNVSDDHGLGIYERVVGNRVEKARVHIH